MIGIGDDAQAKVQETILQEAQRLVHGNRQASYGHPIDDYTCTGRLWSAILDRWLRDIGYLKDSDIKLPDIDPRIATLMMSAMKISREVHKHKRDNLVDQAGYAECTSMIAEKQGL
jgi:hypothetical protein